MSDKTLVNTILHGDAFAVLQTLPSNFIQTCITSPPYYGLRDYGIEDQIGLEETPEAYIEKLVAVFHEVRRVLRDDGTCWINLGDSYVASATGNTGYNSSRLEGGKATQNEASKRPDKKPGNGLKPKDLIGIPWMVAFALRSDGWYLRSDVIWHKPTVMPESVTDRPTTAHEHIFLLAKSERYFYDADAIREPLRPKTFTTYGTRNLIGKGNDPLRDVKSDNWNRTVPEKKPKLAADGEIAGANKRTVWTVASQPFAEAHFATFPPKLIEPCILAGTSPRACEHCGAPWERVLSQASGGTIGKSWHDHSADLVKGNAKPTGEAVYKTYVRPQPIGWQPTCTCTNEGTGTCVILDPFMGAGTTALVALLHHRDYLGIELNQEYITMAKKRIATVPQVLWTGESEAVS